MLFRMVSLSPKTSPLLSLFRKNSNPLSFTHSKRLSYLFHKYTLMPVASSDRTQQKSSFSIARKRTHFSTASPKAINRNPIATRRAKKKALFDSPEMLLKISLDQCSKRGDVVEALRLYKEARDNNVPLTVHHYNVLLYLCSGKNDAMESGIDDSVRLDKGFKIFKQMGIDKVEPNEATFTNASRLAAAKKDPELAFDLVKKMKDHGIVPKLRSYGAPLFGFCNKGLADEAYEIDSHMEKNGVIAEEPELLALVRVSSESKREEKVYEMMHRLRRTVRQVAEETADAVEVWFKSSRASEVGLEKWDLNEVKRSVVKGGGGWHGKGWLGKGNWRVLRTEMEENGVCKSCGEKLVCIDIDPKETEEFAKSLAKLALQKEVRTGFLQFQDWLESHGPFDAVVDGANLGLANQHNFSFAQVKRVVNQLQQISPSRKLPLVVLHQSRVTGGPAQSPNNKKLLETWKKAGALYATPAGSNDDWYWLYAAVSSKCLLVTNDEMRDHLFNLLGNSFFPRWKEKHQVRLKPSADGLILHMPPPYSNVIQESEQGSWHVPTVTGDDLETPRQWLCATRKYNEMTN